MTSVPQSCSRFPERPGGLPTETGRGTNRATYREVFLRVVPEATGEVRGGATPEVNRGVKQGPTRGLHTLLTNKMKGEVDRVNSRLFLRHTLII